MPKPGGGGGGGGGGASLFTTSIIGPPPGPLTVGLVEYISLATIPTGSKIWFGSGQFGSPDKSITFELRTNTTGNSAGTDGATLLLASIAASPRSGTVNADYYKNGSLHTVSVVGTGVEKAWLKLKSKSSTAGSFLYTINYTLE
jgi:hypothetical protein